MPNNGKNKKAENNMAGQGSGVLRQRCRKAETDKKKAEEKVQQLEVDQDATQRKILLLEQEKSSFEKTISELEQEAKNLVELRQKDQQRIGVLSAEAVNEKNSATRASEELEKERKRAEAYKKALKALSAEVLSRMRKSRCWHNTRSTFRGLYDKATRLIADIGDKR